MTNIEAIWNLALFVHKAIKHHSLFECGGFFNQEITEKNEYRMN